MRVQSNLRVQNIKYFDNWMNITTTWEKWRKSWVWDCSSWRPIWRWRSDLQLLIPELAILTEQCLGTPSPWNARATNGKMHKIRFCLNCQIFASASIYHHQISSEGAFLPPNARLAFMHFCLLLGFAKSKGAKRSEIGKSPMSKFKAPYNAPLLAYSRLHQILSLLSLWKSSRQNCASLESVPLLNMLMVSSSILNYVSKLG